MVKSLGSPEGGHESHAVRTKHDPSYYKSDHQLQNLHSLPSQVGSTNTDLLRTQTYLTGDTSGRKVFTLGLKSSSRLQQR